MNRNRMRRGEDGAVAVEFAVILVLLCIILFGIIEFGITLSRYEVYIGAAREGSRYAAVRCRPESSASGGLCLADNSQIITRMQHSAAGYAFFPGTPAADKVCSDSTAGTEVTVSWNQDLPIQIPFLPDLSIKNLLIKGVFRCE